MSYRNRHPDEETQEKVKNEMKKNNIDFSQLVEYKTDNCQQGEPSEKRTSPKGIGEIIGKLFSVIL